MKKFTQILSLVVIALAVVSCAETRNDCVARGQNEFVCFLYGIGEDIVESATGQEVQHN